MGQAGNKDVLIARIKLAWEENASHVKNDKQELKIHKNEEEESSKSDEDGPFEDWTVNELLDECIKLGLDRGKTKKIILVEKLKTAWREKGKSIPGENHKKIQDTYINKLKTSNNDDQYIPIEEWTKSRLTQECVKLGLDETGNKDTLLERLKTALEKTRTPVSKINLK